MGTTLYLECETGISGDMVVGALLDLGADEAGLRAALASLPVSGYEIRIGRKQVSGVDCCDFDVVMDAAYENHDHDMAYLYGDLDGGDVTGAAGAGSEGGHDHSHHGHDHEPDGATGAGHSHARHHGHTHAHAHRTLGDVLSIVDAGALTKGTVQIAHRVFHVLAEAEAKAHGKSVDQVHFHEVGAVDSIVDVAAAAFCLDSLGVTDVIVSPLAEGHGRVRTQHGVLSVPVPAVANIVADNGLVLARHDTEGELVTPTGAAIAAAVRTADQLPATYKVRAVGIGSGKRAYDPVSTVRAMLIEPQGVDAPASDSGAAGAGLAPEAPQLWKLETEVDDCTGEALGYALDRLFEAGVREAHYLPVYMKKNRPAYQIEVLCTSDLVSTVERILFEDTTTIGIRRYPVQRTALERRALTLDTAYGPIRAKEVIPPGGTRRVYPEHDSVAALARKQGVGYQDALRKVRGAIAHARAGTQE